MDKLLRPIISFSDMMQDYNDNINSISSCKTTTIWIYTKWGHKLNFLKSVLIKIKIKWISLQSPFRGDGWIVNVDHLEDIIEVYIYIYTHTHKSPCV